jgi:hypothetical protein
MPGAEPSFGARFLAEADGCTPGDEASYISRKARELRPGRTDFFFIIGRFASDGPLPPAASPEVVSDFCLMNLKKMHRSFQNFGTAMRLDAGLGWILLGPAIKTKKSTIVRTNLLLICMTSKLCHTISGTRKARREKSTPQVWQVLAYENRTRAPVTTTRRNS